MTKYLFGCGMMDTLVRKVLHVVLAVAVAELVPPLGQVGGATVGVVLAAAFLLARKLSFATRIRAVAPGSYGDIVYAGAVVALSLLLLPEHGDAFRVGMLTLAFADPAAALVGRYGVHRFSFAGERRTLEGSLACAVVSALVLFVFGVPALTAAGAGVLVACAEALSLRGFDNLTIPLVAALVALA